MKKTVLMALCLSAALLMPSPLCAQGKKTVKKRKASVTAVKKSSTAASKRKVAGTASGQVQSAGTPLIGNATQERGGAPKVTFSDQKQTPATTTSKTRTTRMGKKK